MKRQFTRALFVIAKFTEQNLSKNTIVSCQEKESFFNISAIKEQSLALTACTYRDLDHI